MDQRITRTGLRVEEEFRREAMQDHGTKFRKSLRKGWDRDQRITRKTLRV